MTATADQRAITGTVIVVGFGTLMATVDTTITNVAIHTLGRTMHVSVASAQWVATAYFLALASMIPASGRLATRFGARRVYILALGLFTVASGACALSDSLPMLVAFRATQGLGAGFLAPLGQLILVSVAGPDRMSKIISPVWGITNIGAIVGPTIGGALISGPGWRWIFLINIPVGLVAILLGMLLLQDVVARGDSRLDFGGLLRIGIGAPLLVFSFAQLEALRSVTAPGVFVPFLAALLLIGDFIRHALVVPDALLDLRLFRQRLFRAGILAVFTIDVAWFGLLLLMPLYFQDVHHLSPIDSGLLLIPLEIGTTTGLLCVGRVRTGDRARTAAMSALLVYACAVVGFVLIDPAAPYGLIMGLQLVAGFFAGISWIPCAAACYERLSPDDLAHASPLTSMTGQLGASLGTALAGIVLQYELGHGHAGNGTPTAAFHHTYLFEAVLAVLAFCAFTRLRRVGRGAALPDSTEQEAAPVTLT